MTFRLFGVICLLLLVQYGIVEAGAPKANPLQTENQADNIASDALNSETGNRLDVMCQMCHLFPTKPLCLDCPEIINVKIKVSSSLNAEQPSHKKAPEVLNKHAIPENRLDVMCQMCHLFPTKPLCLDCPNIRSKIADPSNSLRAEKHLDSQNKDTSIANRFASLNGNSLSGNRLDVMCQMCHLFPTKPLCLDCPEWPNRRSATGNNLGNSDEHSSGNVNSLPANTLDVMCQMCHLFPTKPLCLDCPPLQNTESTMNVV